MRSDAAPSVCVQISIVLGAKATAAGTPPVAPCGSAYNFEANSSRKLDFSMQVLGLKRTRDVALVWCLQLRKATSQAACVAAGCDSMRGFVLGALLLLRGCAGRPAVPFLSSSAYVKSSLRLGSLPPRKSNGLVRSTPNRTLAACTTVL